MTSHRQAAPTGVPALPPRPASSASSASARPSYPRYTARHSTSTTVAAPSVSRPSNIHTIHDYNVEPSDHIVDVELVPTTTTTTTTTQSHSLAKAAPLPLPPRTHTSNIHTLHNTAVIPATATTAAITKPATVHNTYSDSLPDVNPSAPYPLPLFTRNRSRWQSILPNFHWLSVTNAVLVACVIVFVVELIVGATQYDGAFVSSNPMGGPSVKTLYRMGGKWEPAIRNEGQGWRLLSAIWLHAGVLHLVINMVSLIITSYTFERRQRPHWFFLILLATGVLGNLWSSVSYPGTVGVGISGALYGLLGANFAYLLYNFALIEGAWMELIILIIYAVCGIGYGFLSIASNTLDNWAHLGGLLCGIVMGMAVLPSPAKRRVWVEVLWRSVGVLGTCGLFVLFSLLLWKNDPDGPTNVTNL